MRNDQLTLNVNVLDVGLHLAAWRAPDLHGRSFLDPQHYRRCAELAERGALDALFLADVPAIRDDPRMKPSRNLEPTVVLGTVAAATENLGLIVTASTTFNDPVELADRLLSLDTVSGGRLGWNAVTTYHEATAANFGLDGHPDRATRYARAGEFVDVVRALWDSAATGRAVHHRGEHLALDGLLTVPPSAQGAPAIVQAGGSAWGRDLAARSADAVFSAELTLEAGQRHYADVKDRARRLGRDPDAIRILPGLVTVLGGTEAEALARHESYERHVPAGHALGRLGGVLGVDLATLDLDAPVPDHLLDDPPEPERFRGALGFREAVVRVARERRPTLRGLLREFGGYGHRLVVGTPEQVADTIADWFETRAADGFNLMPDALPSGLEDFVEHVVPLLRARGLFRHEYAGTTLRERYGLAGTGAEKGATA
ncbi:NtaA/DmoA family FMN-dependent monooxygenase [Actinomycetospora aeridis]|uniref:NtaA/DmoA family FMN-dependent monooxygenase n=1 Tax=Actinomycetospora aeridis TaxID=3129231 RepID=A0ABU8NBN1_9PSEU